MLGLKPTLFFGYSRSSVEQALQGLREKYERKIKTLDNENLELRHQIERFQEKEALIAEALTDARKVSRDILSSSELKAEEMLRTTERGLSERVKNTENKLKELETTRRTIRDHEEFMKIELKQLLNRQMDMIENIKISDLQGSNEVESLIQNSKKELARAKNIALGLETPAATPPKKNTTYRSAEQQVPVFSLDDFK